MQLRICFRPSKSLKALDLDQFGYGRRLSGSKADQMHASIGWQALSRLNITTLFYPTNLCGRSLMNNTADVYPIRTMFRSELHRNFTQGPIADQLDWTLISAYQPNHKLHLPDLREFAADYTSIFTTLLIVSLLLLICVSGLRTRKRQRKKRWRKQRVTCWTVSHFMLGNYSSSIKSKILISTLLLISLTNRMYAGMTMKTEAVVKTPPSKLRTIDEVLESGANFAWLKFDDYFVFVASSVTDKAAKIRKRNEEVGWNKSFFPHWDKKEFVHFLRGLYQQKHALLFRSFASMEIHRVLCALSYHHREEQGMRRMLHTSVDGPHPFIGVLLSTGFVRENPSYKHVHRAIRKAGEARLTDGIWRKTEMFPTIVRNRVPQKDWPSLKICYSKLGDLSASRLFVPNVKSMKFLFAVKITLFLAALTRLMLERYVCQSFVSRILKPFKKLGIRLRCATKQNKPQRIQHQSRPHTS